MAFSTSTVLWNHHLYLVPKYFYHLQSRPFTHEEVASYPSAPTPWQSLFSFPSVYLHILHVLYKWNNTIYDPLCWLLSLNKIFFTVVMCFSIHFFLWLNNFHCMNIPQFVDPFLCWWTFRCFCFLALMTSATSFVWILISDSLKHILGVGLLGYMVKFYVLQSEDPPKLFCTMAVPFYNPTSNIRDL